MAESCMESYRMSEIPQNSRHNHNSYNFLNWYKPIQENDFVKCGGLVPVTVLKRTLRKAAWSSGLGRWIKNLEVSGSNPSCYYYLDLFAVVPSSPRPRCEIANWSAFHGHQLGFSIVYVIFTIEGFHMTSLKFKLENYFSF